MEESAWLRIGDRALPLWDLRTTDAAKKLVAVSQSGACIWLVTLNWEMVSRALLSASYRSLLASADVAVCDGAPIAVLARYTTRASSDSLRFPRLAGVDLTARILELAKASDGPRVAVIGGQGVISVLEKYGVTENRQPLLFEGFIDVEDDAVLAELTRRITEARSNIVFVALGVPKQDRVASHLRRTLSQGLVIGVGGSFDLLSGAKKRAPLRWQRAGMEWSWRLLREPRLIIRYLVLYPLGIVAFVLRRGWRTVPPSQR